MNAAIILQAVREVLAQGENLLMAVDDLAYAKKVPQAFDASLGGHYRHCLDHFCSVFDGLDDEEANYDDRKRDPRLETDRGFALAKTRELLRAAEVLPDYRLDRFLWARCKVSYAFEASPLAASTVGRELMFCVVHAIHHYALMGVMCGLLEVPLPAGFGVAPATLRHRKEMEKIAA